MTRTKIAALHDHVGSTVRICGTVDAVRRQKQRLFAIVRDTTGVVQIVHERDSLPDVTHTLEHLTPGSAVAVVGRAVADARAKPLGVEVVVERFDSVSTAAVPLPINRHSTLDTRLDWRFLDLRDPRRQLIFRVQTTVEHAMRTFWTEHDFIEIHSPKLMASASESGSELFRVDYFDRSAYLAQSPQFYKQMAMAAGFDRVFEIGPVFRANPSFTSRHDTEFTSVDVEMSWIDSHQDVMALEEAWLRHVLAAVRDRHGDELRRLYDVEVVVPELPFPRISTADAYEILERRGHRVLRGGDLDPEGERQLSQHVKEQTGHEFVFVIDYPAPVRAFYHMRHHEGSPLTRSFDLLWKGVEVTTGAQREHRHEILVEQARDKGIDVDSIRYYLDFFRYGCPPHGGYGFGLSRMLMLLFGAGNVREVTYVYRGINRLTP
jgi:aspartyl-tRNA synthetase